MAPVDVIPLLEGIVERVRLFLALLVLVDVSGRKPRFDVRIGTMAASSTPLLCWEHCVWRHDWFLVALLRCSPLSFSDLQWRYVRWSLVNPRRRLPGLDRVLPFICHFLLGAQGGWCVDKRSSVEVWSSEVSGVDRDAVLCISLG